MKNLLNENIIHVKNGDIEYIQFRKLLEYKDIKHCFTLKPLDFAGFDTYSQRKEKVEESYKSICKELNIEYKNLCRPKQTHTARVEKVENGDEGIYIPKYDDVDGLVTDKKDKALVLSFADCTPLIFYDPVKNVIANTHSGWKGTLQTIGANTVEKMKKEYDCNPKDIICCIGPHIRKCHFEVDTDVKDLFYNKFKDILDINKYIVEADESRRPQNKYYIDTFGINKEMLLKLGLKEENIIDSKICTVCNSDICHSFRAEKELSGRSVSIIQLVNNE